MTVNKLYKNPILFKYTWFVLLSTDGTILLIFPKMQASSSTQEFRMSHQDRDKCPLALIFNNESSEKTTFYTIIKLCSV